MPSENLGFPFIKWQYANATISRQIGSGRCVLGGIMINSHTSGVFRFANGTLGSFTPIAGSYTPAAGSSSLLFEPIDFESGAVILISGTADLTVLYNALP